jgi:hypothetical protein
MSMKISSDTIGNRSRDLPVCSAVPHPLRYRMPPRQIVFLFILMFIFFESKLEDFARKYVTSSKEKYFGVMYIKIALIDSCKWML